MVTWKSQLDASGHRQWQRNGSPTHVQPLQPLHTEAVERDLLVHTLWPSHVRSAASSTQLGTWPSPSPSPPPPAPTTGPFSGPALAQLLQRHPNGLMGARMSTPDTTQMREQCDHIKSQIDSSRLILRSAMLRSASAYVPLADRQEAHAQGMKHQVQIAFHIRVLEAMGHEIVGGRWPVSSKIEALMHLHQTLLGQGKHIKDADVCGTTYLHSALQSPTTGHDLPHLLRFLFGAGVDPNKRDETGLPAAALLSLHPHCMPALTTFLRAGLDPNAADAHGATLMQYFARNPQASDAQAALRVAGGIG